MSTGVSGPLDTGPLAALTLTRAAVRAYVRHVWLPAAAGPNALWVDASQPSRWRTLGSTLYLAEDEPTVWAQSCRARWAQVAAADPTGGVGLHPASFPFYASPGRPTSGCPCALRGPPRSCANGRPEECCQSGRSRERRNKPFGADSGCLWPLPAGRPLRGGERVAGHLRPVGCVGGWRVRRGLARALSDQWAVAHPAGGGPSDGGGRLPDPLPSRGTSSVA